MKFTEASLEQSFVELLLSEGYAHVHGDMISKAPGEVLIEEDLMRFLLSEYSKDGLTETEARSIVLQLQRLPASDLYNSNCTFMRMLSDGFILKREDRNQKDIYIQLINYVGLNRHRQPEAGQLISVAAEPEEQY